MRRRLHRSLEAWKHHHRPPSLPDAQAYIAVADAVWFNFGKSKRRYTCFVILLRPVETELGYPVVVYLRRGRESKTTWATAFSRVPGKVRSRITALVADGHTGIMHIALERGWHFQWCHAHMKRKVFELRGVRALPARLLRQEITKLVYRFLETPHEQIASACLRRLRYLFEQPQCPKSFPTRLSGVIKRGHLLRTYRAVPELNLPVTTNSVEQINNQLSGRYGAMRGLRSAKALRYWLDLISRTFKPIHCRGYLHTIITHRKSVS